MIDPRDLVTGLRQFCLGLVFPLVTLILLGLGSPLLGSIIVGIRARVVPIEGMLHGRVQLPDPRDPPGGPPWSVYLILGVAGGFVDEGRSEG